MGAHYMECTWINVTDIFVCICTQMLMLRPKATNEPKLFFYIKRRDFKAHDIIWPSCKYMHIYIKELF